MCRHLTACRFRSTTSAQGFQILCPLPLKGRSESLLTRYSVPESPQRCNSYMECNSLRAFSLIISKEFTTLSESIRKAQRSKLIGKLSALGRDWPEYGVAETSASHPENQQTVRMVDISRSQNLLIRGFGLSPKQALVILPWAGQAHCLVWRRQM